MNNDRYVDEIRVIRQRQYEETKDMTWEERQAYTKKKSDIVQQQIAKIRAENEAKKTQNVN